AQPLTQRIFRDQSLELADQLVVVAGFEVCVDSVFEHGEAQLFEPRDVLGKGGLESEILERGATPERKRLPKLLGALAGGEVLGAGDEPLEPFDVDRARFAAEDVAPSTCRDELRTELLAKP